MVIYPVADLLKGGVSFLQMLKQSPVRAEGEHEVGPFCGPILGGTDLRLQVLPLDHHVVLVGIGFQLCQQVAGIDHVDDEDTEEEADHKGEGQVVGQPVQGREYVGMDEEIIDGPH